MFQRYHQINKKDFFFRQFLEKNPVEMTKKIHRNCLSISQKKNFWRFYPKEWKEKFSTELSNESHEVLIKEFSENMLKDIKKCRMKNLSNSQRHCLRCNSTRNFSKVLLKKFPKESPKKFQKSSRIPREAVHKREDYIQGRFFNHLKRK